jgi:hypothetical protein
MINRKDCRVTRREIDESELNQKLSEQARSHVASCASCRDFRVERTSLRELVASLEPVAAPGDFEMRLRARLASDRQARTRQPFIFRFVTGTPAIAAAGVIVMLALSLVWFTQRNTVPQQAIAPVPIQEAPVHQPSAFTANKGNNGEAVDRPAVPGKDQNSRGRGNGSRENGSNTASAGVTANDYGVSPAESYQQIHQRAGEVSLSAPLKPMVVSMQDDSGATRRISLPPVSFGAQRLVDNRPVSVTNSRSW